MARVELSQVDKIFDDGTHVVHGLDLDVADHEFLVLVGPSGCGKSTTLRMVAGLETVTAGTIRIDGNVVNEVAPKDRDIAMVFQSYALYPHMTVRENLTFALRLRKLERRVIDERVARVAEVLGITPLLARTPKQLSGGQRQRVAVGRAIVRDPKCFLFDEPLSNLDAKLRLEMRAELRQLHQRLGTTTIYVTHDQEEAITLGDRVVVMHAGVLQQCAPPLEIYRHPVNRFVAGFFGSPPMNFLEGQLVEKAGTLGFESAGARLLVPAESRARLAGHAGQGVVLGIRPECLSSPNGARFPTGDSNRLEAEVSLVQPLGDRMNLYLSASNGTTLVAQIDAESGVKVGQPYPVHVDMARVHFFELGEPGRNLSLS